MSEPILTPEMEQEAAEALRKVDDAKVAAGDRWYCATAGTKYTINGDIDGPGFRHDPELAECWDEDIANLIATARNALPAYIAALARHRRNLGATLEMLRDLLEGMEREAWEEGETEAELRQQAHVFLAAVLADLDRPELVVDSRMPMRLRSGGLLHAYQMNRRGVFQDKVTFLVSSAWARMVERGCSPADAFEQLDDGHHEWRDHGGEA